MPAPYDSAGTLEVVTDLVANGIRRSEHGFVPVVPPEGSIAEAPQLAAPASAVVGAFRSIPAGMLQDLTAPLVGDVSVVGDMPEARQAVLRLIEGLPELRGFDAGPPANAVGLEALTAAILDINRTPGGQAHLRLAGVS